MCGDYSCFCRDVSGRKYSKTAIISRVCLGSTKMFPHLLHKANPVRSPREQFRYVSAEDAPYNSVLSRGMNNRLWKVSSGNNEFMITGASQAYPEIIFDYVIGHDSVLDSSKFVAVIKYGLERHNRTFRFRQSRQSKHAIRVLTDLVVRRDSENLVVAVNYYISVTPKTATLSQRYGEPLKMSSSLYSMMKKVMVHSGAYQDF